MNLYLILLVFAFVCAVLAAFNVGAPRWNLIAAALAFYFAALIFGGVVGRTSSVGKHATYAVKYEGPDRSGSDTWPDGTMIRK